MLHAYRLGGLRPRRERGCRRPEKLFCRRARGPATRPKNGVFGIKFWTKKKSKNEMDFEKLKAGLLVSLDAFSETHLTQVLGLVIEPIATADYHLVQDSDLLAYTLPLHVAATQYPAQSLSGDVMYQTMSGEQFNTQYRDNRDTVRELFADKIFRIREA